MKRRKIFDIIYIILFSIVVLCSLLRFFVGDIRYNYPILIFGIIAIAVAIVEEYLKSKK